MRSFRLLTGMVLPVFALLSTGCLSMKSVRIHSIEDLRIEQREGSPVISFGLRVENPNNWGIRLMEAETGLAIDQKQVGQARTSQRVKLRRKSETMVPVQIQTSYSELLRLLPQGLELLSGQRTVNGRAQGTLKVGKFIFTKRIGFDYTEQLDQKNLKRIFSK